MNIFSLLWRGITAPEPSLRIGPFDEYPMDEPSNPDSVETVTEENETFDEPLSIQEIAHRLALQEQIVLDSMTVFLQEVGKFKLMTAGMRTLLNKTKEQEHE
jgi:hypothetical protein